MIWDNFRATLGAALELFKKDPLNFVLIFAIPVIAGGLLSQILLPMVLGGLMFGPAGALISLVIFIFCTIVLEIVAYLALVKAVIEKSKGNKIDLMQIFTLASKQVVPAITLGVKAFLTIFHGISKFINSWFALIYFMESDTPVVDTALKASQDNCQGKTITLVWNVIIMAIASSIAINIITGVWVSLTSVASYQIASLGTYLASGVISSFTVLFHYVLKGQLEKIQGASHAAAPTSGAPTN